MLKNFKNFTLQPQPLKSKQNKSIKKIQIFHKAPLLEMRIMNIIAKKNWSYFFLKLNSGFTVRFKSLLKLLSSVPNNAKFYTRDNANNTKLIPTHKLQTITKSNFFLTYRSSLFNKTLNIVGHLCWPWIFDIHNFDTSNEDTDLEVNKPFMEKIIDKGVKSIKSTKRLNFLLNHAQEQIDVLSTDASVDTLKKKKKIKLVITRLFAKLKQFKHRSKNINKTFKILTSLNLTTFNSLVLNTFLLKNIIIKPSTRFWVVKFNSKGIMNTSRFRKNNNPYLFLNNKLSLGVKPTRDSMDFNWYKINTSRDHKSSIIANTFIDINKVFLKKNQYSDTTKFNIKLQLFHIDLLGKECLYTNNFKNIELNTRTPLNQLDHSRVYNKHFNRKKSKLFWFSNGKYLVRKVYSISRPHLKVNHKSMSFKNRNSNIRHIQKKKTVKKSKYFFKKIKLTYDNKKKKIKAKSVLASWNPRKFKKSQLKQKSKKYRLQMNNFSKKDVKKSLRTHHVKYFSVKYSTSLGKNKKKNQSIISSRRPKAFNVKLLPNSSNTKIKWRKISSTSHLVNTRHFKKIWKLFWKYTHTEQFNVIKRVDSSYKRLIYLNSRTKKPFVFRNIGMFLWSQKNSFFKSFLKIKYLLRKDIYSFIYPNEIRKRVINRRRAIKSYRFLKNLSDMKSKKKNHPLVFFKNNYSEFFKLNFLSKMSQKTTTWDSYSSYKSLLKSIVRNDVLYDKEYSSGTHVLTSWERELFLKRIKFKPGYQRIWRKAREALAEHLNMRTVYQQQITRRLSRFYRQAHKPAFIWSESTIGRTIIYSHLLPDFETINLFKKKEFIFLNGTVLVNLNAQAIPTDFLQLMISNWFYIYNRWITNNTLIRSQKLKRLIYRKSLARKYKVVKLRKQKSHYIPKWIKYSRFDYSDVRTYMEVDFLTMSAMIIYNPYIIDYTAPDSILDMRGPIYRMYNWKYIT